MSEVSINSEERENKPLLIGDDYGSNFPNPIIEEKETVIFSEEEEREEEELITSKKKTKKKKNSARFDFLFLYRLFIIFFSKMGNFSIFPIAFFIMTLFISALGAVFSYLFTLQIASAMNHFKDLDYNGAWMDTLRLAIVSCVNLFCNIFLNDAGNGLCNFSLFYYWRKRLTRNLLKQYYRKKNYYVILNMKENSIDNPDQRIQSDAKDFCFNLSRVLCGSVFFLAKVLFSTYVVIQTQCYWLFVPIILWPVVSVIIYALLFTPVSKNVFRKDQLEGDFRFAHARVREHSESIAFFKSEERELKNADRIFKKLIRSLKCLSFRMFFLTGWTQIAYWCPSITFLALILAMFFLNVHPFKPSLDSNVLMNLVILSFQSSQNLAQNLSNLFGLAQPLSIVIGNTARIGEMISSMNEIERDEKKQEVVGKFVDHEEEVRFEGVNCVTPKGKLLIKNVDFVVRKGENLLIMGPSGCGKSSILRLLCGLWSFEDGIITRPSKIGRDGIFFLPQKPYLINESLKHNIIYPLSAKDTNISDEELTKIMDLAGIGYLLKRASLHDENVFWDEKLSIGEQQRVAMARLFFHRPAFAILDECTSALDPENEELCYSNACKLGITLISVAHRKSVMKFHHNLITVNGNGDGTYLYSRIDPSQVGNRTFTWDIVSSHTVDVDERDDYEEESVDVEHTDKNMGGTGLNLRLFVRSFRFLFCGIMIRSCWMWCFVIFAFLVACITAFSPLPIISLSSQLMGSIIDRQLGPSIMWMIGIGFGFFFVAFGIGFSMFLFMLQGVCCRQNVTKVLHRKYFKSQMFYEVNALDKSIDNSDQRICADTDVLTSGFQNNPGASYMEYQFLNSIVMCLAILVLSLAVSWIIPVFAIILYSIAGGVSIFFLIVLSRLRFLQQKREGYLRFSLTRMKEYSEQIAFYGGKDREMEVISRRLKNALRNQFFLYGVNALQTGMVKFFDDFGYAVSYAVIIISIKLGILSLQGMKAGEVYTLIQNLTSFMGNSLFAFLGVLNCANYLGQVIGSLGRVASLLEKMDSIEKKKKEQKEKEENDEGEDDKVHLEEDEIIGEIEEEQDEEIQAMGVGNKKRIDTLDYIRCLHLTGETPTKKKLFYDLTFKMTQNMRVLIQGPSGCGKSSLLRIIGGLWPIHKGVVFAPNKIGENGMFFLPQKPYLFLGSLKQQIIYPDEISKWRRIMEQNEDNVDEEILIREEEKKLLEILKRVNLGYIVERLEGDWNHVKEFNTILSPGEAQRIGLARMLYHKPMFAILDESTSALDEYNEDLLYRVCMESRIAFLSVGHRKTLVNYHSHRIQFDRNGNWEFLVRDDMKEETTWELPHYESIGESGDDKDFQNESENYKEL